MSDYLSKAAADAHNLSLRVSKKVAWAAVRELIAAGSIRDLEAAQLYRFFQPAPPKKPKTRFDWLCQAIDKKDKRPCLHFVHVDSSGNGIATNGRILLIDPTIGLAPGFYDTAGTLVPESAIGGVYPDVWRVVPADGQATELFKVAEFKGVSAMRVPAEDGKYAHFPLTQWGACWSEGAIVQQPRCPASSVRIDHFDGRIAVITPLRP